MQTVLGFFLQSRQRKTRLAIVSSQNVWTDTDGCCRTLIVCTRSRCSGVSRTDWEVEPCLQQGLGDVPGPHSQQPGHETWGWLVESPVPPACKQNSSWLQDRVIHGFIGTCIAVHTIDTCYRCISVGKKYFTSCFIMCLVLGIIRPSLCECKINCINRNSSLKNISPQKAGTRNHILLRLWVQKLLTCEEFGAIHC